MNTKIKIGTVISVLGIVGIVAMAVVAMAGGSGSAGEGITVSSMPIDPWKPNSSQVFMQVLIPDEPMRFTDVQTNLYGERYALPMTVNVWNGITLKPKSGVKVEFWAQDCKTLTDPGTCVKTGPEIKTTDSSGEVRFGYVLPFNGGYYTITMKVKNSKGVYIADYVKYGNTQMD